MRVLVLIADKSLAFAFSILDIILVVCISTILMWCSVQESIGCT